MAALLKCKKHGLAEYLLDHPGDVEAVVALAGWALDVAEGEDW